MVGVVAALWGLFGGFAVEGLELHASLRHRGRWPWKHPSDAKPGEIPEAGAKGYIIAEMVRLIIGAGLAWATAATGQIAGPLGAFGVGVAAPTIVGQLAKVIPLTVSQQEEDRAGFLTILASAPQGRLEPGLAATDTGSAQEVAD